MARVDKQSSASLKWGTINGKVRTFGNNKAFDVVG
jgi:hypothetical protein